MHSSSKSKIVINSQQERAATTRSQGKGQADCRGVATDLDEFARLSSLLQGAAHLVRGEVEGGVAGSDVLLDRLDAGAVALLESLDGLENHLRV